MFNPYHRSDVELVADILRLRGSQTAIMYGANLSYKQTQKYLHLLSSLSLIATVRGVGERPQYGPTAKGEEFIELVERMEALLAEPGTSSME